VLGHSVAFDEVLHASKRHVMRTMLASELQVLANTLDRIAETNWRTRDFTLAGLRAALEDVAAYFPVYRTYVDEKGVTADDRRDIDWAVGLARRHAGDTETTVFDLIHAVLTTDLVRRRRAGYSRRAVIDFAKRFQQFTGPVTAKSLEDTSFYRFTRLLSLNEVGGDPRRVGTTIAAFHHVNQERARLWPAALIATATHDTKRGADARARLNVLSEMARDWGPRARHWATLNRRAKTGGEGQRMPGRNDEYFLYQTLIGAWPNELMDVGRLDRAALDAFRGRVEACALKAVREAKVHTSWAPPNPAYEEALANFIRHILDPDRSSLFLADFTVFAARIAWFGMLNGLAQTLLKLTLPGVPDLYQGTEAWDYSLVDPDNRRPVDFDRRMAALAELRRAFPDERPADPAALRQLLDGWPDGRIKLLMLVRLLHLRRAHGELFRDGGYVALATEGRHAEHVCAFARVSGAEMLIAAVPRLVTGLVGDTLAPLGGCWGDTAIVLPPALAAASWTNVLSGETVSAEPRAEDGLLRASTAFAHLPAAAFLGAPGR
jgi:(1->4)-alpha-D-glucan 1-alpha-D-glucosylmutase